jgi:hypothetical protein
MGLYPTILKPSDFGLPQGPYSNVYVVDPANGDDDNRGTSFEKPLLTLAAAYAKCVTNQNDCVAIVGGQRLSTRPQRSRGPRATPT